MTQIFSGKIFTHGKVDRMFNFSAVAHIETSTAGERDFTGLKD